MSREQFIVGDQQSGERLDRIVVALQPSLSRNVAAELIAAGRVEVNGRPSKPAARVLAGARITIEAPAPRPSTALAEDIPLRIVYEDQHLVVVDKPAGMVVHPAPGNESGTLVNALLGRYAELPGPIERPGIVHRLDKDTSGLMVVARTAQAVTALSGAFKRREVDKEYLTLLIGTPTPASGTIEAAIGRDPRHRQRMAVLPAGGRDARTGYSTVETFRGYALVRVALETGRMHQIRVHFSALGHPVAGDPIYGRAGGRLPLRRQFLHAARLAFAHPATGAPLDFSSELPEDLARVLALLRAAEGRAAPFPHRQGDEASAHG